VSPHLRRCPTADGFGDILGIPETKPAVMFRGTKRGVGQRGDGGERKREEHIETE
jgi:hypothetical protein